MREEAKEIQELLDKVAKLEEAEGASRAVYSNRVTASKRVWRCWWRGDEVSMSDKIKYLARHSFDLS